MYLNILSYGDSHAMIPFCTSAAASHKEALSYALLLAGYKPEQFLPQIDELVEKSGYLSIPVSEQPTGITKVNLQVWAQAKEIIGKLEGQAPVEGIVACPFCQEKLDAEEMLICAECGSLVCPDCALEQIDAKGPGGGHIICPDCWNKIGE